MADMISKIHQKQGNSFSDFDLQINSTNVLIQDQLNLDEILRLGVFQSTGIFTKNNITIIEELENNISLANDAHGYSKYNCIKENTENTIILTFFLDWGVTTTENFVGKGKITIISKNSSNLVSEYPCDIKMVESILSQWGLSMTDVIFG